MIRKIRKVIQKQILNIVNKHVESDSAAKKHTKHLTSNRDSPAFGRKIIFINRIQFKLDCQSSYFA